MPIVSLSHGKPPWKHSTSTRWFTSATIPLIFLYDSFLWLDTDEDRVGTCSGPFILNFHTQMQV